jgi:hypothetical protein
MDGHILLMEAHIPLMDGHILLMEAHIPLMEAHISLMEAHISLMEAHIPLMDGHILRMEAHISLMEAPTRAGTLPQVPSAPRRAQRRLTPLQGLWAMLKDRSSPSGIFR